MMDKSFGLILAVIALVAGIMLLTGHGDILLKGGNAKLRKEKYDEKKMTWGSGVALLLIGVATLIDSYTTSLVAEIIYIIVLIAILGWLVYYLKTKCAKK